MEWYDCLSLITKPRQVAISFENLPKGLTLRDLIDLPISDMIDVFPMHQEREAAGFQDWFEA